MTAVRPASAGMSPVVVALFRGDGRAPRVSGDEPVESDWRCEAFECAPRQRG